MNENITYSKVISTCEAYKIYCNNIRSKIIVQFQFYLTIFIIYILVILFIRHRNENRLYRNDLFNETICEQCDKKLRVSSNAIIVIIFVSKRIYIAIKARSFLFEEK